MGSNCKIEVVLYDSKKWYQVFSALPIQSTAIRLDKDYFVVCDGTSGVKKVKVSSLEGKVKSKQIKDIPCRNYSIGKIWLENCLYHEKVFTSQKAFITAYVKTISDVKKERL